MKTTLEIPDPIFRRAKSVAAERGIPFRQFVTEAVQDKLKAPPRSAAKPWMKTFGKLRHLHKETARISRILDVDQETTIYYATLRTELKKAGTPIPANDVWVAALCRQYRLPILSRDRHFDIVAGLRRIDW
jgi:hypothetical protein